MVHLYLHGWRRAQIVRYCAMSTCTAVVVCRSRVGAVVDAKLSVELVGSGDVAVDVAAERQRAAALAEQRVRLRARIRTPGSPSTSAPASPRTLEKAKFSSRRRYAISWPDQESDSLTEVHTSSREFPVAGSSSRLRPQKNDRRRGETLGGIGPALVK
jgi:hypothetical protein